MPEAKKLQVKIDLDDVFTDMIEDESSDFMENLIFHVKQSLSREIVKNVSNDSKEHLAEKMKGYIDTHFSKKLEKRMDRVMSRAAFRFNIFGRNSEEMTIEDFIKNSIKEYAITGSFQREIKEKIEDIGKKLMDRYDEYFATQIISKLHKNDYLKKEAVQAFLPDSDDQ